nr:GT-D fold domain-containing glycosyltransferase [Morganella morganii]
MKKEIDLFLIAAGPTGTVLSARLADNGKTALDIGNLVSSYNTVFPEQLQAE